MGAVSHIYGGGGGGGGGNVGGVVDAAYVEGIGMIAVLERAPRSVVLYSGTTKVGTLGQWWFPQMCNFQLQCVYSKHCLIII